MDEKFEEICSCDALLTRGTLQKAGVVAVAISLLTIIIITYQHVAPFSQWLFEPLVWAKSYPMRSPLYLGIAIGYFSTWFGYGVMLSPYQTKHVIPEVVLCKPKSVNEIFRVLMQIISSVMFLFNMYVIPLEMYLELFVLVNL